MEQPHLLEEPLEDLQHLPNAAIDAAIAAVPSSWWREDARRARVREALVLRRDQLPDIILRIVESRR